MSHIEGDKNREVNKEMEYEYLSILTSCAMLYPLLVKNGKVIFTGDADMVKKNMPFGLKEDL